VLGHVDVAVAVVVHIDGADGEAEAQARSFMPTSSVASTKRPSSLRKKWSGAPLRPKGPNATSGRPSLS
jgi:hypothetical protein